MNVLVALGWVTITAAAPPQSPSGYEWRAGCVSSGQYELPKQTTTAPFVRYDDLPDAGRCYFAVLAVPGSLSEEAIFDFDRLGQIPSTPAVVPVVTWMLAQPVAITVTLSNVSDEFDLEITGTGPVTIALTGGAVFDWLKAGNTPNGGTSIPTMPSLGPNNNDGITSPQITVTAPVMGHADTDGSLFNGANITVGGVTKPLVRSGATWSVSF